MSKRVKIIVAILFSLCLIQFTVPSSFGTGLSESEKLMKDGIVLYVGSNISYVNSAKSTIDSGNQNIFPLIKGERTLVPIRFVAEKLNADVTWDEASNTATLTLKGKVIKLKVNDNKMLVDNKEVLLDVAPEVLSDRTFVPLRAVVEAFGKKVFWDRGLIIISDDEKKIDLKNKRTIIDEIISKVNVLPSVDSLANLKNILSKIKDDNRYFGFGGIMKEKATNSAVPTVAQDMKNVKSDSIENDYSKTNVQVEGVDEADVVKTDGEYIYQVNDRKVFIIKTSPANDMKIISKIEFDDKNFTPSDMYVDSKNLIIIGNSFIETGVDALKEKINDIPVIGNKMMSIMPPYYRSTKTTTKAMIFDLADKTNIKKIREVEVEGGYTSSRKIGSALYMVTQKWINTYNNNNNNEDIVPCYRDTNIKNDYIDVDFKSIHYFPGFTQANYMIVAGVNLDDNSPVNVYSYLGAGNNIYASTQSLYVASQSYDYQLATLTDNSTEMQKDYVETVVDTKTQVYKFMLQDGNVSYGGKGEVKGTILNQFSMDENNDYFRIATTSGEIWRQDKYTSKNNVYILDKNLTQVGQIEDIAPGEKIYSTRFMGNRLYMVTFKQVDPLFVIDLSSPTNPQILGKLKIPGYSEYLHPYDENHIIGFGKDAVDSKNSNFGLYLGMKIAMFDVTDVNNPIEMFKENIGDRGTYSELLNNHKALLFSKEKNLLAFPVTLMTIKEDKKVDDYGNPKYGTFAGQGLYVYNVDLVNGFKLKGTITHMTDDEIKKSGDYWYDYYNQVERGLYIKDKLYTLSKGIIKANDLNTLKELNSLTIEKR